MPIYPLLRPTAQTRLITAAFPGLDCRTQPPDGAMAAMTNLSTLHYPALATREPRGLVRTLDEPQGLTAKDSLIWVDGGQVWLNGLPVEGLRLSPGEKQLVSMGAWLCIFPDKLYLNTEKPSDCGSMEAFYQSRGEVRYSLCRADGTDFTRITAGPDEPEDTDWELWLSTAGGTTTAMSYSASAGAWVKLDTVYTKLRFTTQGELPRLFSEGDGVSVSGAAFEGANGEKILYAVGGGDGEADYLVLVGLLPEAFVQTEGSVCLERRVPDLDFVCQAGNRLWGCFYGVSGGEVLNELYCCALGDFKNWRQYRGLATDSWAAGVGSDGAWTGAVNYLGCPTFFKEECIHQITISPVGAHAVRETVCRGVQKGSHKSLAVVNETLYYKSRADFCAWQGGFPLSVSEALGELRLAEAAAGAAGSVYYVSARGADGAWNLLSFDTEKGLWSRQDGLHALQFAWSGGELYALDADSGALYALHGRAGQREESFHWECVSGVQAYEYPDRKTLSRYNIRARLRPGAQVTLYFEYDGSGEWVESGTLRHSGLNTATLPVRPRRCDHLRLKLAGSGEMELMSITRVLELGSDVVGTTS